MKKLAVSALLMSVSGSSYGQTETCNQYFSMVEAFITEAAKHDEAKDQIDMLNTQLAESKKKMESFSVAQQESSCKQGLKAMKHLYEAMGIE